MATFSVTNINDSGSGSLRQAILSANALSGKDTINFKGVFVDAIADTITLGGSSLIITDDLNINGKGADLLSISGDNASRVFEISSGTSVKIEGLTITNGYSYEAGDENYNDISNSGGGILNSGILTLKNSTVSGNFAYNGGGIFNSGTLTLKNSTVSGNSANNGGGIYNSGSLTVNTSTISGNGSDGIYNFGSLTVNSSTINGNSIGIVNFDILTVNNSTISRNAIFDSDGNILGINGGGIISDGTLIVNNTTISNNGGSIGGGIYITGGTAIVSNSTIKDNLVSKAFLRENAYGGGIYNSGTLTLSRSTVSNNSASFGGGIVNDGNLTVDNSIINNNSVAPFSDVFYAAGGGIYNSSNLTVSNSTISGNSASSYGGGIYNTNSGTATVSNSTIDDNLAASGGGGISNGGGFSNGGTLTVNNSTISSNSAFLGGGIDNYKGSLTVNNSTISSNSAPAGGGINNEEGSLTVSNSTITLNQGYRFEGDDIYIPGVGGISNFGSGTAIVKNSIVAGNIDSPDNQSISAVPDVSNPDVAGNFISNGFNLIGKLDGSTGFNVTEKLNVAITEVIDTTLRDNGGTTKTHALVTGSRAINAGNNVEVPADTTDIDGDGNTTELVPFDQRGLGFARISGGKVDIGAFEAVVNIINGTPGRNTINGTAANDLITGFQGKDTLSGSTGADAFCLYKYPGCGDIINDFEVGIDKIVLRQLFQSLGLSNLNFASATSQGYLRFAIQGDNTVIFIDPDGSVGRGRAVNFITTRLSTSAVNNPINFAF